jgi:hypothetical protein
MMPDKNKIFTGFYKSVLQWCDNNINGLICSRIPDDYRVRIPAGVYNLYMRK